MTFARLWGSLTPRECSCAKIHGRQEVIAMFEYKIPDNIKTRIPEYFYYALGGECVSVFGADALIRNKDGFSVLEYSSGTFGYVKAFDAACKKLGMEWLLEYYVLLPWYHSDIFDGEIIDEVMKCFSSSNSAGPYYQYLISHV